MSKVTNYNQMAQIIKDSAGVVNPSGPPDPKAAPSAQEIVDSTGVTLPAGLGSTTGTANTNQAIDDSLRVTLPSGLGNTVQKGKVEDLRVTLPSGLIDPSVKVEGEKGSGNVNDGGGSVGTQSSIGAADVVSDFDYYKNKLDQDGTAALIKNKYESQVKQTATESARYVAENINKGNQSYEQNAYIAAQTADKFGWSGGYALDAARQVEYLRASIQADIFSQQELQKLGYKSNLEAAYASAELELNEQAQNNYYQAQQMAISQAQLTGQYIDPAIADMCIQASAASAIMNKEGIDKTSPEYQKAQKVYDYMVANLNARGNVKDGVVQITPVAIQTLADIQMEMEKLNFEQAKIQVLNSIVESGGIALPVIGDDGQIISWTSSPSAAINENLAKFYQSQPDAFTSKVNELMTNMSTGYTSWLQMKDANGRLINDGKSFNEFLIAAYKNPNTLTDLLKLVNPEVKTYTQGDLTATKDNEGNWTINFTGTTSSNGGSSGGSSGGGNNLVLSDIKDDKYTFEVMQFGDDFNLMVNTAGDDLSTSHGTICRGDNMSLKVPGEDEIYRVEIGYQVEYGTPLDIALNKISTAPNSIAYIEGTIFVRDNDAWYTVKRREMSYHEQWDKFQTRLKKYFGISDESSSKFAELIKANLYDNYKTVQGRRDKV